VITPADPDEVSQPWWDATRERRLVIQRCQDCRRWQHYPRALCTGCGGLTLTFEPARGHGVVDTCTTVLRPARPGLPAPYVLARVRLAEGPLLLTQLIEAGQDAAGLIGRSVTVDWAPLPDGRNLPVFRLSEG
jgi:uncharacterized OB-fold protein